MLPFTSRPVSMVKNDQLEKVEQSQKQQQLKKWDCNDCFSLNTDSSLTNKSWSDPPRPRPTLPGV